MKTKIYMLSERLRKKMKEGGCAKGVNSTWDELVIMCMNAVVDVVLKDGSIVHGNLQTADYSDVEIPFISIVAEGEKTLTFIERSNILKLKVYPTEKKEDK